MPKKLPPRLSREEATALLAIPSRRYPTGIRNRALLRLMYRAGLRCAEALDLEPRDINFARKELRVRKGKGGKPRILWLDATTLEYLDRWRELRPSDSSWFFCTLKGGRLLESYARAMVSRYGHRAKIAIPCHPHLLRHTFASEFLEDGGTPAELQRALGHERFETTMIYVHVADDRLRRFMTDRPG